MINQRRKGHDFEREIAQRYREAFPGMCVFRGQQGDGAREPDVAHDRIWTECKRGRRPNARAALSQAIRDCVGSGRMPVAVTRADRDQAIVTLLFDDFLVLLQKAEANSGRTDD